MVLPTDCQATAAQVTASALASPAAMSMSTMRLPPKTVVIATVPGRVLVTTPMIAENPPD